MCQRKRTFPSWKLVRGLHDWPNSHLALRSGLRASHVRQFGWDCVWGVVMRNYLTQGSDRGRNGGVGSGAVLLVKLAFAGVPASSRPNRHKGIHRQNAPNLFNCRSYSDPLHRVSGLCRALENKRAWFVVAPLTCGNSQFEWRSFSTHHCGDRTTQSGDWISENRSRVTCSSLQCYCIDSSPRPLT